MLLGGTEIKNERPKYYFLSFAREAVSKIHKKQQNFHKKDRNECEHFFSRSDANFF